ncbi:O-methyltransferase [Streptomyces erythrochromogenes]
MQVSSDEGALLTGLTGALFAVEVGVFTGYPAYYEEIVRRLRPGGLVVLDNVFLGGRVLDPAYREKHHLAMRGLNDLIAADERVDSVMLPVRDGVTIARRR